MTLTDLISPAALVVPLKANGKKQAFQEIAIRASQMLGLGEREIFDTLLQRERLGSTGIGDGIAIPHGRLPSLSRLFGLFARLEKPIDFDALDGQPVDIIVVLLAPEGAGADHLKALSRVARVLRDRTTVQRVRMAQTADAVYAILTEPSAQAA